jgi:hypothetical protein
VSAVNPRRTKARLAQQRAPSPLAGGDGRREPTSVEAVILTAVGPSRFKDSGE